MTTSFIPYLQCLIKKVKKQIFVLACDLLQWDFMQFKRSCEFIQLRVKVRVFNVIYPFLLYFKPFHMLFLCYFFFQAVFIMHFRIIQNFSKTIYFFRQSDIMLSGMFFYFGLLFTLFDFISSVKPRRFK